MSAEKCDVIKPSRLVNQVATVIDVISRKKKITLAEAATAVPFDDFDEGGRAVL